MAYTPEEQIAIDEYCGRERVVTLRLYGLTEEDLTPLQAQALSAYLDATLSFYLTRYGPYGPRGAALRVETEEEARARQAFEEAIKTPERRLRDRITGFVHEQCVALAMGPILSLFIEEEEDEGRLSTWRQEGVLEGDERLFEVTFYEGFARDCSEYRCWLTLSVDGELAMVRFECCSVEINGNYYSIRDLVERAGPTEREDLHG